MGKINWSAAEAVFKIEPDELLEVDEWQAIWEAHTEQLERRAALRRQLAVDDMAPRIASLNRDVILEKLKMIDRYLVRFEHVMGTATIPKRRGEGHV